MWPDQESKLFRCFDILSFHDFSNTFSFSSVRIWVNGLLLLQSFLVWFHHTRVTWRWVFIRSKSQRSKSCFGGRFFMPNHWLKEMQISKSFLRRKQQIFKPNPPISIIPAEQIQNYREYSTSRNPNKKCTEFYHRIFGSFMRDHSDGLHVVVWRWMEIFQLKLMSTNKRRSAYSLVNYLPRSSFWLFLSPTVKNTIENFWPFF